MSVRRLADDSVQPASFAFSEENAAWAEKTIRKYPEGRQQSAVIPLLMRAQEQDGWVTKAAIEMIADMLGMAYIRVLEVATFYTQFQLGPVGTRAHIQVCGTTPCMLRGSEDLMAVCKSKIHPHPHHLNADGTLSWEEVECLGACVNAPMVAIFKDTYEDLTPRQLEYIIERFEAGRPEDVKPGPQIDRISSAPFGGLKTLTSEDAAPATAVAPKKAKAEAPKAEPAAVEAKAEEKADDKKADAKPSLDDPNRPAGIEKPATPDDLKMISGVGPKIEGTLQSLGIYTFAQIAAWKAEERAWVDSYLNFRGRIDRDEWVKQAEVLARGGEEEYLKVFGKKPR
ncbi:NADH-quinone oxidoreductase subunit NuoE [Rhizobium alvei]|uniref:NADH-quinone oxidoreductase subunit NuoE n=1 Tax=Rhizobium alvei TaxID=1132659 RepID=A0ABT8YPZ5_9HYPH|nr:NADH-quinone oxidoreductase subunit NuoE [Rhizobium alvei]MDO6965748.1 NADH-quinone oxidoreductase subunit NuoE [Rhizobium alvei]